MKKNIYPKGYSFLKNNNAVASIEVTLTIGIFFAVLFLLFEFGRVAITSTYWDLAVSEGVRYTKNSDLHNASGNYSEELKHLLEKSYNNAKKGTVMGLFAVNDPVISVCVNYDNNINEMITTLSQPCQHNEQDGKSMSLARYSLTYDYEFAIPLPFIQGFVNKMFQRQFIMVQEHERSEFIK